MRIIDYLFWASAIIAIAVAIWALFGHSPTIEQLIITFMFAILLGVYDLKTTTTK